MICEGIYLQSYQSINHSNEGGNSFVQSIDQGKRCVLERLYYIMCLGLKRGIFEQR